MNKLNSWQRCLLFTDTAESYLQNPEEYIRLFSVTINGKLRHLVTYQPNEKGRNLRILHTNFSQYLSTKYRQCRSSYAYAKGRNILECVNRHLNAEIFLKTDIHAYFDSISCEKMIARIGQLHIPKENMEKVALFAKACFYQNRLPLGFTSSPLLSDLFLVTLDRKYQKNKKITYTRYADDFILSASGAEAEADLLAFQAQLEKDLDLLNLQLNHKKTYLRSLQKTGDAIHVLGVNIVRTDTRSNRITISDRYIRETCKALCEWLGKPELENDSELFSKLYGRISFIKQCSNSSFDKLRKMTKIKCGYDGPLTAKALKGSQ